MILQKDNFPMGLNYIFTSESVSEGHPDKVCDRVSDAILDLFLTKDKYARVACEVFATTNKLVIGGEVRCLDIMDGNSDKLKPSVRDEIITVARHAVRDIGYEQDGFHWQNMDVDCLLHGQSPEIAQGVDEGTGVDKNEGAGDQGIMFGYATNETPEFMPAPLQYCHHIMQSLNDLRHSDANPGFGPDMKSQVSLRYENGKPVGVSNVVVSAQHTEDFAYDDIRAVVAQHTENVLPDGWMPNDEDFYVNPTGKFVIGGPDGDAGLTGRKIIVDSYGGAAPHGGGAFSGKDPTKVDRSAAYAARWVAKNIVAAGLAEKCVLQVSYAIGVSKPLSIYVDTFGTGQVRDSHLADVIAKNIDLSPRGIRESLNLNKAIYTPTSSYGHFGRDVGANGEFSWEALTLVDLLKKSV